jgi:hypothetical protein
MKEKCEHTGWQNLYNGFWECRNCLIQDTIPRPLSKTLSLQRTGGGADSNAIRFGNLPEKISVSGGSGTSPQPEEWIERFDEMFIHYSDFGNTFNDEIKPNGDCEIKNFLKSEIRKAEERGYMRGVDDAFDSLPKEKWLGNEWNAEEYPKQAGFNQGIKKTRASLEALKK